MSIKHLEKTKKWLETRGFYPQECDPECDEEHDFLILSCPSHALLVEADRLKRAVEVTGLRLGAVTDGDDECVTISASYDPVAGDGVIAIAQISDEKFFSQSRN